MILEAIKKRFKAAFDADKNGGIEALNGIKIGNPSGELVDLTRQVVMGSLLLGCVQAQDGIALADDDFTVSFDEKSVPFNEAVEYLKSLISLPKKEWEKLERCVQFRAFTVAALAEADGIEKVRKAVINAVENGKPIWESWQEIEALTEKLGNKFSPGYWETVYRTNAQTAYNAGRLMQYKDNWPPAWELLFIQDKRQSDTCKDLAHIVGEKAIPSDHHFWKTYGFPPYHFNCRTTFRAVYDYELTGGEIAVVRPSKKTLEENFAVQEGFGGNPLEKESWWKMTESMVKRAMKYGILEQVQEFGKKYGVDLKDFKATVAKVKKAVAKNGVDIKANVSTPIASQQTTKTDATGIDAFKNLKDADKKLVLDDLNKISSEHKELLAIKAQNMQADLYHKGGAFYSRSENKIYVDIMFNREDSKVLGNKTNVTAFLHESGHWLDYNLLGNGKTIRGELPELRKKLKQDALQYCNNVLKLDKPLKSIKDLTSNNEASLIITKKLKENKDIKSSVSDIFSGLTQTHIHNGWGHRASYWKGDALEKETIANFFEAKGSGGEKLKTIKEHFPTAYRYFEEFLEGLK